MAVTARLVGNLGGVKVTRQILSPPNSTAWQTFHTVQVPAGETWLIAASVTISNYLGQFELDGKATVGDSSEKDLVITKIGPASVQLRTIRAGSSASISLYTVPIT